MSTQPTMKQPCQPDFGTRWFAQADLGDERRQRRLICSANQLVAQPGQSLPDVFHSPKDLKALYRLMANDNVSHESILRSARQETLSQIRQLCRKPSEQPVLVVHDITELDYSKHKSIHDELGQVGNGGGKGYICHNSLALLEDGSVLGLANQILHRRVLRAKTETRKQMRDRESRETRLWLRGTAELPSDHNVIDICDAGADTAEFLEHEYFSGRRFVIRSGYQRSIQPGHEGNPAKQPLQKYIRRQRSCGGIVQDVPGQGGRKPRKARKAKLLVSFAATRVFISGVGRIRRDKEPMALWMVRVWEPHPPAGEDPIEWRLWTNEPIGSFGDALRIISWYTQRWTVEEYHKAMKTGCRIEQCQFTSTDRLEPMIALLSVVATSLLRLRDMSRRANAKCRSAKTIFPREYVIVLSQWRWGKTRPGLNVHDFFYALARLGGHQNRRRDKPPGWQILWRGWQKLQAMVTGYQLVKKCG